MHLSAKRQQHIGWVVAAVGAIVAVIIALLVWRDATADDRAQAARIQQQERSIDALSQTVNKANADRVAKGQAPLPVPSQASGESGIEAVDVDRIVSARLAIYRPSLTLTPAQTAAIAKTASALVPKPTNGTSVTLAQVEPIISAAVDRQVAALPKPADGEPGEAGPGPTDEQVDAAARRVLAEMCGDTCEGTDGTNGTNGTSIQPGDYDCPPGRFQTGQSVLASGLITLRCADIPDGPGPQPSPSPSPSPTPSPTALKK